MKKVNWRVIVIIISSLVLIYVSYTLIRNYVSEHKAIDTRNNLYNTYCSDTSDSETENDKGGSVTGNIDKTPSEGSKSALNIDYEKLCKDNEDAVGWIKAGEDIDYPVVQRDNGFYLDHDFYGEFDYNGIPFLNAYCSLDPRDDVLLVHGHDMENSVMFSTLKKFEDSSFLAKYPIVIFSTVNETKDVYYTPAYIFNASMISTDPAYFDIMQFNFKDDAGIKENEEGTKRSSEDFKEYINLLEGRSLYKTKVDVNVDDKLLMLITCSYKYDDGRLIVVCRKLRDGETPDSILKLYK